MKKIKETLRILSNKNWILVPDYKEKIEQVTSKSLTQEETQQINNYSKFFKQPLKFDHDLTTYKTGRIFAQYVLFPNKPISGLYLKELIIPRKGYIFVSFDYSGSQIRHLASYKNIQWLKDFFETDQDIYEKFAKETNITRDEAKVLILLLLYGGNEKTIEEKFTNISKEKAKVIIDKHNEWFELQNYNYESKSELSRTIQRIESDFIKEKIIHITEMQDMSHSLHAVIHDEIIIEVLEKEKRIITTIQKFLEKNEKVKMKVKVNESTNFRFK